MTHKMIEYALEDGFIHNWLAAGPVATPEPLTEYPVQADQTPTDGTVFEAAGEELRWVYYRCLQDHLVNFSTRYAAPGIASAWVYVNLRTPAVENTKLSVFSDGQVEAWLNGTLIDGAVVSDRQSILQVKLEEENALFIRFEAMCGETTTHTLAVRLDDFIQDSNVTVCVPTRAMFPHRHKFFEGAFEYAYLEQAVHHKGNLINIRWAEDAEMTTSYAYKVRDVNKQIYVEGKAEIKLEPYDAGHPQRIWERPYHIALQAPEFEHWEQDLRYERLLPFHVLDTAYASKRKETYFQRRKLALEHASRREPDLFAEIAKMTAETWEKVGADRILGAVEAVNSGHFDSSVSLVGLLGMLKRWREHENFPKAVIKPIENCVQNFDYSKTGQNAETILTHTAAVLAGGMFPRRKFKVSGLTGANLRKNAIPEAKSWIRDQGRRGISAWTAPSEIERTVVALTHLTSLAEDQTLSELSAVLLDKVLFILAVNSHKGAFGAARSRASAGSVKSAQLSAVSGINRLLFGVGVYNPNIAGPVSLACSNYEYPSFFAEMAIKPPAELVHKESQVNPDGLEINALTYRTPDTMLSSAQDYQPGRAGAGEHVWQATLGPDAIIYTNHPAAMGEQEGLAGGFWLGNGSLPRLVQWKENLVAVYNLAETDRLGFTHAYFPTTAFEEHVFARGWAFARVGEGFVGLTCSQDFELITQGQGAYRELRAQGRQAVWLCVTGRQATYGGFRKFQQRCMAINPTWETLGVAFETPQGDAITFGWTGDFKINGQAVPLAGFKHIENPYCTIKPGAAQMDIQYGEILMRLNFE